MWESSNSMRPKQFGDSLSFCSFQIRTLGMLRSRFHLLPSAFSACLIPSSLRNGIEETKRHIFHKRILKVQTFSLIRWHEYENSLFLTSVNWWVFFCQVSENEKNGVAKFALVWNQIIGCFRAEDLINNRYTIIFIIKALCEKRREGKTYWPFYEEQGDGTDGNTFVNRITFWIGSLACFPDSK